MKNILILDTGKEWGGGTNSLLELLRRLDKKNYKFTALFYHNYDKPGESNIKTEIEKLGIDFFLFAHTKQSVLVKFLKEIGRISLFFNKKLKKLYIFYINYLFRIKKDAEGIAKILKALNIDLLYMNNQPSTNLEGIIAAQRAGIKSLLHSRIETGLNFFEVHAANKWLTKMICVSEGVKENFIRQGINDSKCSVVHNGIDVKITPAIPPRKIREEFGIKEDEILIGSAGLFVRRKRFDDLIKAISYLTPHPSPLPKRERVAAPPYLPRPLGERDGVRDIKCIILGAGPEKKSLQKEINRNGLDGTVLLTGFKSDAISHINAMDIFVLPSEREGFPRVVLEAMLMGKPVIATRIAGPLELVKDSETGFLYNTGDIKTLSGYIAKLASELSLRKALGEAGRKRVLENFFIEKYVSEVEKVFTEVLGH